MLTLIHTGRRTKQIWQILLSAVVIIFASSSPTMAELGGGSASVYRDSEHMTGSVQVRSGEQYTVYEIRTSTGTIVREFVSPNGTVFAVGWEGHFVPEMKQILGTYFEQ